MSFCAVCTADIAGEPLRRPLGKNGAIVNVCVDCDTLHPRSGRYAFDNGDTPSKHLGLVRLGSGARKKGTAK